MTTHKQTDRMLDTHRGIENELQALNEEIKTIKEVLILIALIMAYNGKGKNKNKKRPPKRGPLNTKLN